MKESNLTAATLHIMATDLQSAVGNTVQILHTHDQESLVHKQTMSAYKECVY